MIDGYQLRANMTVSSPAVKKITEIMSKRLIDFFILKGREFFIQEKGDYNLGDALFLHKKAGLV